MDLDDALARNLLSASPDALWLLALDGSTVYANDRLAELLGRRVDQLTAETVFDVTDDQGRLDLAAHLEEMRSLHPGRQNEEVYLQRPDGTGTWTLASWAPAYDDDGLLLGYLHRLTEYTDRRALVERLTASKSELATAQSIARLGSWTMDVASERVKWSNELYLIYGVAIEGVDISLETILARSYPADRDALASAITDCLRPGEDYVYEGRIVTPDGDIRWIKSRGLRRCSEDGTPLYLHGTCQETTDLHEAADEVADARRRLRLFSSVAEAANRSRTLDSALGHAALALQSVDAWRALATWRLPAGSSTPILLDDLTSPDDDRPDVAQCARVCETGEMVVEAAPAARVHVVYLPIRLDEHVIRVIQLEGRVAHVDEATRSLLDQVSATLGRVAEREKAAIELAVARDDAMASSAHKSEFLATMSHEIRTPMNGVIGLTDLLLKTELDPSQLRLADGLRGAGLTLLALINDILDLSKIESGAVELERAPFEVTELLDQTATIVSGPAQEKRLELVVTCDPAVPQLLVGDRLRLGQVLVNLASNAVKFTDHGEVVVELGLEPSSETGRVMLRGEVRDTGIGIGADASMLFEAFTQADRSTTRTHGGTGLGLAISRRLVNDMGGSIGADERPGGGSVFWFVVPVERATEDRVALPEAQVVARRALVVDDNPRAAAALERQLISWGHVVDVVGSADQAITALLAAAGTDAAFELALIDLHMPDGDGLSLGSAIAGHSELAQVAMILLSDDPSTRVDEVVSVGFDSMVQKPLRPLELRDAILGTTLDTGEVLLAAASDRRNGHRESLGLNILVVEDNPVNQLVAEGLLDGLGCVSSLAANGEEAVAALAPGHPFDLVLMDCRMPRMDGYVATEKIRAQEQGLRVPIVAMTASALAGERDRCLAVGMDDFLTKPVDPAALRRMVTRWSGPRSNAADPSPVRPADHPRVPPADEPCELPILDLERVSMLSEMVRDGVNFFERTRSSFLSRIDETLATIRAARDLEDLDQVEAVAHQLKGSASNLGLARVAAAAGDVEVHAAAHDLASMIAAVDALELSVTEGVQALASISAENPTP